MKAPLAHSYGPLLRGLALPLTFGAVPSLPSFVRPTVSVALAHPRDAELDRRRTWFSRLVVWL